MRTVLRSVFASFILIALVVPAIADGELRYANLKDITLENGQRLPALRIAYRTFGTLNADKSNAVIFPTWLSGTTKELVDLGFIGPGKTADSSRWFVIAIDNPGNGVSSSPSNSIELGVTILTQMSLADLVKAQHVLVTEHLGLRRLHAVMGISMGALQALQWTVAYPDLMKKVVAIAGTPRLTSYELLLWHSQVQIIDAFRDMKNGGQTAMRLITPTHALFSRSPQFFTKQVPPDTYPAFLSATEKILITYEAQNWAWQIRAIMTHDITKSYGGSMEQTAASVRAKLLVVVSPDDRMVYPQPMLDFARLAKATVIAYTGNCGHFSFLCERDALSEKIQRYISD